MKGWLIDGRLHCRDHRIARAIDDMIDAAAGLPAAQADGDHVVHLDARGGRSLDGIVGDDRARLNTQ